MVRYGEVWYDMVDFLPIVGSPMSCNVAPAVVSVWP
jgi:hypothetical protein